MSHKSLNIILSCDDGLGAEGTVALAAELSRLGTVRACGPERHSSGAGHAVTLHEPVCTVPAELPHCEQAIAVRGTPADSVKLAVAELWPGWADLVVSGINSGPNVGVNVFYSGTVGAAAEGTIYGMPAIAISLDVGSHFDFKGAAKQVRPVLARLVEMLPFPPGLFFNVNIPASGHKVKGIRLTRHGKSGFKEFYRPSGEPGADGICYWQIDGKFHVNDPDDSYDAAALSVGYISVAPMVLDMTADPYRDPGAARTTELQEVLDKLSDWRQ